MTMKLQMMPMCHMSQLPNDGNIQVLLDSLKIYSPFLFQRQCELNSIN